ncbi:MAG: class II aldolase/adducin family protein [Pseudomonadota bacterium]|nr:class II aldolase/adducin family protein [Pseudomonadota bacterium]
MSAVRVVHASIKDEVSKEEWQQRVDLAACYRLIAHFGWDDLIYTHISARLTDNTNQFLFNPYGLMFEEMTASSLIKVDLDGTVVSGSEYGVNPAGFVIHGAILSGRRDVCCVLHLHTDQGMAVSAQEQGLLPLSQIGASLCHDVAYHEYDGPATGEDEKTRLARDLGEKNLMILRNHGTLSVGQTIADAFLRIYGLERACRTQVLAMGSSAKIQLPSDQALAAIAAFDEEEGHAAMVWDALLRMLDRRDGSYRD